MSFSEIKINQDKLVALKGSLLDRICLLDRDKQRISVPLPRSLDDQASVIDGDEVIERLDEMERDELENINRALRRIEDGRFGICGSCGGEIEARRLEAVPYAMNCIKCENGEFSNEFEF